MHGCNTTVLISETNKLRLVNVRALSRTGGTLQIRLDKVNGPIIAQVKIPKNNEWNIIDSPLSKYEPGIHNLIVQLIDNNYIEIDWVSYK